MLSEKNGFDGQRVVSAVGPVAVREGFIDAVVVELGPEKLLGGDQAFLRHAAE